MSNEDTASSLVNYWIPLVERCGVVLDSGDIVELKNHHPRPSEGFILDSADYGPLIGQIVATWHTHPKNNANLSSTDYRMFLTKPQWLHYIVYTGIVRSYKVMNGTVYCDETRRF